MKYILFLLLILIPSAAGHVGYVLTDSEFNENLGADYAFLLSVLQDPVYVGLMVGTALVSVTLYFLLKKNVWFMGKINSMLKRLKEYDRFVPWMARLGLGIALIGAGSANVFISPSLSSNVFFSSLQIALGFMLLAGFLIGPCLWACVALYVYGLSMSFYLLGNLDFLALAFVGLALKDGRPGIDHLFNIPFFGKLDVENRWPLIARLGIGVAMIYLALYEKLLNPHISEMVVHNYDLMSAIPVSAAMWVFSAGAIELVVGLVLLLGFRTRLFSAVAFIVLSMSFFYFNEEVFSHITLFTILSILFVTGSGWFSVDRFLGVKTKK